MTSSWKVQSTGRAILKIGLVSTILILIVIGMTSEEDSTVALPSVNNFSKANHHHQVATSGHAQSSHHQRLASSVSNQASAPRPRLELPRPPGLKRVKGFSFNVFLLSALVGNYSHFRPWDTVVLQGWENKSLNNETYKCCFKFNRRGILGRIMDRKSDWTFKNSVSMPVKQYVCPVPKLNRSDVIEAVTISARSTRCHSKLNWYVKPQYVYKHEGQVAVCSKFVYGSIAADDIMSWFEIHRRLGVSKVLMFTYDLNPEASRVLAYYRSIGLAEIIPFTMPKQFSGRGHKIGQKSKGSFNDEQVVVYDCQARLRGYTYMLMLDLDEYLIPSSKYNGLIHMFDDQFKKNPHAAGFRFLVKVHVTSWGATSNSSQFKIGRYLNHTSAMNDRMKHVVKPERIVNGGVSTHNFYPKFHMNFKRYVMSAKVATIHHFRSCRNDWYNKTSKESLCYTCQRFTDNTVADLIYRIEDDVIKLKQSILNTS